MASDEKIKEQKREEFIRAYANLPLGTRQEIVAVLEPEGPVTWEAAYFEIKNKSQRGDAIIEKLVEAKLL